MRRQLHFMIPLKSWRVQVSALTSLSRKLELSLCPEIHVYWLRPYLAPPMFCWLTMVNWTGYVLYFRLSPLFLLIREHWTNESSRRNHSMLTPTWLESASDLRIYRTCAPGSKPLWKLWRRHGTEQSIFRRLYTFNMLDLAYHTISGLFLEDRKLLVPFNIIK